MKFNWKRSMLMIIALFSFSFLNVNAQEVYYTNLNGVQMTEEEYNKIITMLSETRASTLTQEQFEHYISGKIIDSNVRYIKDTYQNGILINQENISEFEYENDLVQANMCSNSIMSDDDQYIETSYKRFNVTLTDWGDNDFSLLGSVTWKQTPATRSYDVFAFRLSHMNYVYAGATQTYFIGNNYWDISYTSSSTGYNGFTNGAGVSMNLVDGTDISKFEMTLVADLEISEWNYAYGHAFVSYQHATSSITQVQSKSYTLGAGGLGDVIVFSSNWIASFYDDTPGIMVATTIPA